MILKDILQKLIEKIDLTADEMTFVMSAIFDGKLSSIEISAFLVALRSKGESVDELIVAVKQLRGRAQSLEIKKQPVVDIVGTGGDELQTFNISTCCCFVVAAAGGFVAKHGNRKGSSSSGAADVLEAAGMNLDSSIDSVKQSIETTGFGFLFAPKFHAAMKQVADVRKTLAIKTIFNLIGPLANPTNAQHHLIGVYDRKWLHPFAEVLKALGSKKALIVHGADGLDEITIADKSYVMELNAGKLKEYEVLPEDFGIKPQNLQSLVVKSPQESLAMMQSVFGAKPSAAFDIVRLNSGAALYTADLAASIKEGVEKSTQLLESGAVQRKFEDVI